MLHFRKILHPHDFSEHAIHAFYLACSLARDHKAQVVVLHVNPFPPELFIPYKESLITDEEEGLGENLRKLKSPFPEVEVKYEVVTGEVVKDILRVAQEEGCDLIVMGTHGRKGVRRILMGSIAERVTREAPCPVVTVRTPSAFTEETTETENAASE